MVFYDKRTNLFLDSIKINVIKLALLILHKCMSVMCRVVSYSMVYVLVKKGTEFGVIIFGHCRNT